MLSYKVEFQDASNAIRHQTIAANSVAEAAGIARDRGLYVLNIVELATAGSFMDKVRNFRVESGPGLNDILNFTKQLAVMIKAGIGVREAIDSIAKPIENQKFKAILMKVKEDIESGESFSQALAKHPKCFSPLYINMVKASEMSGTFAHMLERIVDYLTQQAETRRMVVGAMVYPAVLFTLSVSAVIFLIAWVLPRFTKMFEGKEEILPAPTKILMGMSDGMRNYWHVLLGGLVLVIVVILSITKSEKGKIGFDKFKLKMPIFKKMLRALYITRSLQALGELVNAGVPILDALAITADISGNYLYRKLWSDVSDSVREGNKIGTVLDTTKLLPSTVVQMISAGEASGRLGDVLQDISGFYEKELKDVIKTVTSLIEPIMIVFMGVVVGFIAMSIILPVFSMNQLVQ